MKNITSIAIIGGTGDLGSGLAKRWSKAGYRVLIGSRDIAKARDTAEALASELLEASASMVDLQALTNEEAAAAADLVVLTVPFSHQLLTLDTIRPHLAGKILIDVTVPLVPPRVARVQLPAEGSAGQRAQDYLGEGVQVVSAFQNVAATHLQGNGPIHCDVLVCGDDKAARKVVVSLAEAAGMRAYEAGAMANSAATEAMTSLLIFINKQYRCHAGIQVTGPGDQH